VKLLLVQDQYGDEDLVRLNADRRLGWSNGTKAQKAIAPDKILIICMFIPDLLVCSKAMMLRPKLTRGRDDTIDVQG
jgi:hypothetical protein